MFYIIKEPITSTEELLSIIPGKIIKSRVPGNLNEKINIKFIKRSKMYTCRVPLCQHTQHTCTHTTCADLPQPPQPNSNNRQTPLHPHMHQTLSKELVWSFNDASLLVILVHVHLNNPYMHAIDLVRCNLQRCSYHV